jgi:hypothetical protein
MATNHKQIAERSNQTFSTPEMIWLVQEYIHAKKGKRVKISLFKTRNTIAAMMQLNKLDVAFTKAQIYFINL